MKDYTAQFMKQSPEYGRRAKETMGRVDNYVSKSRNILKIIGKTDVKVRIYFGRILTRQFCVKSWKIPGLVRTYGELYFLELYYNSSKDTILVKLNGLAPRKENCKSLIDRQFCWKKEKAPV